MSDDQGDLRAWMRGAIERLNEPARTRPSWTVTSGECDPGTVQRLLRSLPEWFGIESSVVQYVAAARELPAYLAWAGPGSPGQREEGQAAGVLLAVRHFPWSAEIYLMAVEPGRHRQGAGRALIEALEADLITAGIEFLQVKTLGPARADAAYDATRLFYTRMGFRPLEELHGLWPGNPCLIMIKSLRDEAGPAVTQ